ncbi:hypothetical protein LVJ94_51575 [Pendulispora rubella]|uniref:DUF4375 domain-containing protein n=1 Tax=Pendulispora rubella TaxID=2741070 RepID=A0ABZ2L3M1_9BACT
MISQPPGDETPIDAVKTPAELLAIEEPWQFAGAVICNVHIKYQRYGWEALTAFERLVWHGSDCAFREAQWMLLEEALDGEERCTDLVAVLDEIGAHHAAEALRQTFALYAAIPPEQAATACTQGDWIELAGESKLEAVRATLVDDEVDGCLRAYINHHRDRLRPD